MTNFSNWASRISIATHFMPPSKSAIIQICTTSRSLSAAGGAGGGAAGADVAERRGGAWRAGPGGVAAGIGLGVGGGAAGTPRRRLRSRSRCGCARCGRCASRPRAGPLRTPRASPSPSPPTAASRRPGMRRLPGGRPAPGQLAGPEPGLAGRGSGDQLRPRSEREVPVRGGPAARAYATAASTAVP